MAAGGEPGALRAGLGATLGDHAVLLDDDADLALLTAILTKRDAPFGPRWAFLSRQGHGLETYFACLCL